tara:strand:- start:91 stop:759 length:669 start_codon:yes stop_codon:yes gene_type:complete
MKEKLYNILRIFLGGGSLLRKYQINFCSNLSLKGLSLELGATEKLKNNFSSYIKSGNIFHLSNNFKNKKLKIFKADLTKKLKIKSNTYDNVLIFNVLEHLPDYDNSLIEINRILKKKGMIIGSTPFIYQIHGAPKDYFRFTKQFFENELKKKKFTIIKIDYIGRGPFTACYSLLFAYLRFLPIFSHLFLLICFILDNFLQIFVKTKLKDIFPIGIIFLAKKK